MNSTEDQDQIPLPPGFVPIGAGAPAQPRPTAPVAAAPDPPPVTAPRAPSAINIGKTVSALSPPPGFTVISGAPEDQTSWQSDLASGIASGAKAAWQAGNDTLAGIGAGALTTAKGIRDIGYKAVGKEPPTTMFGMDADKLTTPPDNIPGTAGKIAEQVGEFVAPEGIASKAGAAVDAVTKLPSARILGKAIIEYVKNAGVAGAQTGGDPNAMAFAGNAGALTSGVANAAKTVVPRAVSAASDYLFPNKNNPVVENALQSVEPTVPMSVGQRTGNEGLQRVEQNLPGSQDFYKGQQEAIANRGEDLMGAGSGGTNAYGAGKDLIDNRLPDRITKLKGQADNLYDQVRTAAAANQQTVQTGVQTSPVLSATGGAITTPVMQTFESPVDLQPIRTALTPVYQDLMRSMPEAKRAASPAFTALSDLMNSTDPQMNAMDFDKSLSAIKALARDGSSPYLTNKSQAIAKQIVGQGEQQLTQALAQAGPDVNAKLQSARNMVKAYYNTADLLGDMNDEPGAVYSNLTSGGDRVVNTLQQLQKIAPKQVATIGQTYLQGLLDKATNEGGFGRSAGIMADWNRMGPETKQILFGKSTNDLDNFMLAAKRLTQNANPSGTAKMAAALGALGAGGEALYGALMGIPAGPGAVAGAVSGVGAGYLGAKMAAEVLFNPKLLKSAAAALIQAARPQVAPSLAGAGTRIYQMLAPTPPQGPPPMPPGTMPPPR